MIGSRYSIARLYRGCGICRQKLVTASINLPSSRSTMTTRLALCALALLGSACAARKAIVPEIPARTSHPTDLSDITLMIRNFVIEKLTHKNDTKLSTVTQLHHSFELYLTAQTHFQTMTSDPAGIRGARLYADVH